jgi:hypothetical protein
MTVPTRSGVPVEVTTLATLRNVSSGVPQMRATIPGV